VTEEALFRILKNTRPRIYWRRMKG